MKAQKTTRSLSRIKSISGCLPYVCSDCRHDACRSASNLAIPFIDRTIESLQRQRVTTVASVEHGFRRWLHNSSRHSSSLPTDPSTFTGNTNANASPCKRLVLRSVPSSKIEDSVLKNILSRSETIRGRLKQWSEEQSRLADASGIHAPTFPGLPPPNSLLLEDLDEEADTEFFGMEGEFVEDDEGTEQGFTSMNQLALEPGDVFHVKLKGVRHQFAVFLGILGDLSECLLADGRWVIARAGFPNTVILPGFAPRPEVDSLRSRITAQSEYKEAKEKGFSNTDEYTVGELPLFVTASLTRRLSALSEEILSFQREHPVELDGIYGKFALENQFNAVRFEMLVKSSFGKELEEISMGARYAIFSSLRKNEGRHTIVRNRFNKIDIYFTPSRLYKYIIEVTAWARQYQDSAARAAVGHDVSAALRENPLNTFINKARRIILRSRKIRSPTTIGSLGPSSKNQVREDGSVVTCETGEILSREDLSIIEFMWCTYLRQPRASHDVSARSVGALILRAIGAYPKMQLNTSIARLFFREMGLMAPWSEDIDQDLRIPAPGRRGSLQAQTLIRKTDKLSETLGFTSDATHMPLPDTMADLRKDWGDVVVYCVDKPTTSVLDDGFSLEDSSDISGAVWVHVHIAHPTAFVRYNSDLHLRAELLTSAIYTSAKLYSMLPEKMTYAMSLRPNAAVMTVSSLVLEDGKIGDVKITVGTIRRIVRLEPRAVAAVLGAKALEQAVLQVGPSIHKKHDYDMSDYQDAEKHAPMLRKLRFLHSLRLRMRRKEIPEYPTWRTLRARNDEYVSWTEVFDGSRHVRDYHYLGDPTIRIVSPRHQKVVSFDEEFETAIDLTGHTMVLACESAGRWLKQRKIPAIFHGAVPHVGEPSIAELNAQDDETSTVLPPRMVESSKPVPHAMLGVAQYVRLTSPLRRFVDNIAQWQIDAYLRAEATGHLPKLGDPASILPFTSERIDTIIQSKGETAMKLNDLKRTATIHWSMQAIFRAFHFNEAPLPAIWDAQVTRPYHKIHRNPGEYQTPADVLDILTYLQPFYIRTLLLKSKEGWEVGVKRYQYLPVKIEYVDTTARNIYARAVGPASWQPTQSGPLRCVKPEDEGTIPIVDQPTFHHGRL